MAWAFLIVSVLGVVHGVNALHPMKRPVLIFGWSFFASWLTLELVWHHIVIGLLWTALFVSGGALDSTVGVVALALMVVAEGLLLSIALTTRKTKVIVGSALADLDPGPDAPRFPRSHVVLPVLMKRRKGVSVKRNIE